VVENDAGPDTTELLKVCTAEGVKYISLDPPTRLTRGEEESRPVPIGVVIDFQAGG
jgi:hypothetical protein